MDKPYSARSYGLDQDGSFAIAIRGGAWRNRRWLRFRNIEDLEALLDKLWVEYKKRLATGRPFSLVLKSRSVQFSNVDALDHLTDDLRRECKSLLREAAKRRMT